MLLLFPFCRFHYFTFLPPHFYGVLGSSASALVLICSTNLGYCPQACFSIVFHQLWSVVLLPLLATDVPKAKSVALASYPSHSFHTHCRKYASLDFIPDLWIATPLLNLISDMLLAFYRHHTYFFESLHNPSVSH